jgi:hypothetical protein
MTDSRTMLRGPGRLVAAGTATVAILLAACSGSGSGGSGSGSSGSTGGTTSSTAPSAATSSSDAGSSASTSMAPGGSATAAGGATTASAKVSANTASEDEIKAALSAAGVKNASKWADEVVEYRPYPADDANLQKLQDNLAKYNPDPDTLQGILSALKP